ncbi:MAG: YceI family protein [Salinivirgaceae bacterium]|nr:YceI family protein [Salinivirgaceae bacterium]MDD4748092.1 YceI family protein [Salinivirgaceae bacterium]MDY0280198.1 YceI family protein [Salinivirgaceae bacterium]
MKTKNLALSLIILLTSSIMFAQKSDVNTKESTIEWLGKKIGGQHNGNIQIKSGSIELKNEIIVAGNFIIDMTTITNLDLEDEKTKRNLVGHLKSDDFFGVAKYPTAIFTITKTTPFKNGKATITGNITIKENTEPITFEVVKSGKAYQSKIEIDRSKFNVRYGSDSFFDNLGDKVIDDIFTLDIKLVVM